MRKEEKKGYVTLLVQSLTVRDSGDMKYLTFDLTSQNYDIERSYNFVIGSSS